MKLVYNTKNFNEFTKETPKKTELILLQTSNQFWKICQLVANSKHSQNYKIVEKDGISSNQTYNYFNKFYNITTSFSQKPIDFISLCPLRNEIQQAYHNRQT